MARIEGVDLPHNKRLDIALTSIFGIGRVKAKELLVEAFGDRAEEMGATRSFRLTDTDISMIREVLQNWREAYTDDGSENPAHHKVEGDLRRETSENIKRLISRVTEVLDTVWGFLHVVSVQKPTLALEKVRSVQWLKRNNRNRI